MQTVKFVTVWVKCLTVLGAQNFFRVIASPAGQSLQWNKYRRGGPLSGVRMRGWGDREMADNFFN